MPATSFFEQKVQSDFGIRIVDLRASDWQTRLFEKLEPPFIQAGGQPLENLLNIARHDLNACTAVIEPYISTDWNSEYSAVYSRVFAPIPRWAQRIHFFTTPVSYEDLYELSGQFKEAYIGYAVVRPLKVFRVGDTVLASPWRLGDERSDLVHCHELFNVTLLGNRLTIRGMPFFQQDRTVGVCAQADLWMVARYLNKKGDTRRYRPAEIHSCATKTVTVGPPREGLHATQMMNALHEFGLHPLFLSAKRDFRQVKDFVYSSVESELPVIAGIHIDGVGGHVVVVIGHSYRDSIGESANSMSEAVNAFIVHDDAYGPYRKMDVASVPSNLADGQQVEFLTLGGHQVEWFVLPFPPRVHMDWIHARLIGELWIGEVSHQVAHLFKSDESEFWPKEDLERLVTRTYLRLSSAFKSDLLDTGAEQLRNEIIIARYKCMQMPKYVWVIELAKASDLENIPLYRRKIRGEIILDSTAHRDVPEAALLAFHFNGKMFVPGRRNKPSEFIDEEERAYSPLRRTT